MTESCFECSALVTKKTGLYCETHRYKVVCPDLGDCDDFKELRS